MPHWNEATSMAKNSFLVTTFSHVKDTRLVWTTSVITRPVCMDGHVQVEHFCEREKESHFSIQVLWKKRMETHLEWETADWTYGFGKFEVLFSEQFPAVNLQCLCELLLKPNPWPGQGHSFQRACREEFFSWQAACLFSKGENDRQEEIKVYTCMYINLSLH